MAKTTPNYAIPYPELTDKPDGATQMRDLATQVDVKLKPIDDRVTTNANQVAALNAQVNGPLCVLEKLIVQSVPDPGGFVPITWDVEIMDVGGMHAAGNTSRITAPIAGMYTVAGAVLVPSNATGVRRVQVAVNGAALTGTMTIATISGYSLSVTIPSLTVRLAVNDYLEVFFAQTSGAAMNVGNGQVTVRYICP